MNHSVFAFTMQHRLIALAILFTVLVAAAFFLLHGMHAPFGASAHPSMANAFGGSNTDW